MAVSTGRVKKHSAAVPVEGRVGTGNADAKGKVGIPSSEKSGGGVHKKKRSSRGRWYLSGGLGLIALLYVGLDYLRENGTYIPVHVAETLQLSLWAGLGVAALVRSFFHPHWSAEVADLPRFLLGLASLVVSISLEGILVHFTTAVMGLRWHRTTLPLPDTGQWALLALNDRLPSQVTAFLRAPIIGLHHFLMLFFMLSFSATFGSIRPSGLGIGARYMMAMSLGRYVRLFIFAGTIVPSPRPWCADTRFPYVPEYPHPWAQQYHTPYAGDVSGAAVAISRLLRTDQHVANGFSYPPEYRPDWGRLQFLVDILRPWDPSLNREIFGGGSGKADASWFTILKRAGGGCNDLVFSGHVLVATLTAMAYLDAYPGMTAAAVWVLLLHSAQREIRERHHYTADVVVGMFVGVVLWRLVRWGWGEDDREEELERAVERREKVIYKAAKDGNVDKILLLLEERERARRKKTKVSKPWHRVAGVGIVVASLVFLFSVFLLCRGG